MAPRLRTIPLDATSLVNQSRAPYYAARGMRAD
jgi:hypothetical protein